VSSDEVRVLTVGGEASFAGGLQGSLAGSSDLTVVDAADADGALERIPGGVDCVLVGDGAPGIDPLEALSSVRERFPELPALLLTGRIGDGVVEDAFAAGATDVVRNADDDDAIATLERRIHTAVDHRRERCRYGEIADRYRNLLETAPVPVAVHVDGEFQQVNPTGAELLGAEDPDDLVGREVMEFVHPEDRELAREHLERAVEEGRSPPVSERLVGLDGEVRHLRMAAARTTFDGDPAIQIVGQDVTEREARRRELERERDRFSALFENVPNPAIDVGFEGETPYIADVNEAFESVFGYDRETVTGRPPDEVIVPENYAEEARRYNELLMDGDSVHGEVTRETADGTREFLLSIVPHDAEAERTRGFAIYTEITERNERERKLAALHEATRELVDAETVAGVAEATIEAARGVLDIPFTGVFLADGEEALRPVATSEAAREAFDVGALRAGESVAWDVYESGEPLAADDIREHGPVANPDTEVRSELIVPLGEYGVFQAASTSVEAFSEGDRSLASVLAANVETALASAQQKTALRERRQQVERQNERLEEFANVVSHDLRNPLEQARGYLDLYRDADDPDPDHLEAVAEALARMEEIISDVLTLARQGGEVEETESVDLDLVARECWGIVSTPALELESDEPPTVLANDGGLRQLLENVFRNAVEHADSAEVIRVGSLEDGFYVEDDGPGIPPEVRDRAFDADYSAGGGTGFGLAIVDEVAQAHGWDVAITDAPGGGARFEVTGVESV
jgi:PAS domain S-box-containing protein